jgi:hypothetical protein
LVRCNVQGYRLLDTRGTRETGNRFRDIAAAAALSVVAASTPNINLCPPSIPLVNASAYATAATWKRYRHPQHVGAALLPSLATLQWCMQGVMRAFPSQPGVLWCSSPMGLTFTCMWFESLHESIDSIHRMQVAHAPLLGLALHAQGADVEQQAGCQVDLGKQTELRVLHAAGAESQGAWPALLPAWPWAAVPSAQLASLRWLQMERIASPAASLDLRVSATGVLTLIMPHIMCQDAYESLRVFLSVWVVVTPSVALHRAAGVGVGFNCQLAACALVLIRCLRWWRCLDQVCMALAAASIGGLALLRRPSALLPCSVYHQLGCPALLTPHQVARHLPGAQPWNIPVKH